MPASGDILQQLRRPGGALLAPMSGITDAGMRRAALRFGATLVVSEMVASDQLALGEEEARLRAEGDGIVPHVVQIAGCEPRWMAEGARAAEAAGAAIIDINMGCPAKRVTNGWSGSALMRDLDNACRLIDATVSAVSVPVTLKTRLGWDHANLNAPELARRAEALGVRMITIHGRTRQQFYKGRADWKAVLAIREATTVPLVVNGDIADARSARSALSASGAEHVMIGRGALGRPWLVGEIAAELAGIAKPLLDGHVLADAALAHYEFLLRAFGVEKGLRHARKHVVAYHDEAIRRGGQGGDRAALATCEDPRAVMRLLRAAFESIPAVHLSEVA
ncbi:MAG TPA: tRNA-dihydrouridine synthase [Beijerinckiaceae bacterium]|nr:tRNA-dihydrouridine synthase [Beijerinckiaceae bacterium]